MTPVWPTPLKEDDTAPSLLQLLASDDRRLASEGEVFKRFRNGAGDSVAHFYQATLRLGT